MRSTVRAKKKKVATLIANITGGRVSTCLVGFYTPFFPKPMGPYRGRALELPKLTFFFFNFSLGEQTGKKIQRKKSAITGGPNVLCYLYGDIYLYACQCISLLLYVWTSLLAPRP